MKYTCTECWYVYDEAKWEPDDGINPGTKIIELWDYFTCPSCYTDGSAFIAAREEVNYPLDKNRLSKIEQEHQIFYEVIWKQLHVKIGEPEHAMGESHYISSISLVDDSGEMIEERFLEIDDAPEIIFDLDYLDNFEILCRCTQHWLWGSGKIENAI